ncbi:MAG: DUF6175 family protein [Prevotellaceae bacterium]|jgi:hypothetical protein|nr:DUF6175 family protein [Prevotellaceae bacterium]
MKKLILIFATVAICLAAQAQEARAKKPTLMVIPSEAWCFNHGYTEKMDNQGTEVITPNYKVAFQTNSELNLVISKIGELMTERGFPLKDMNLEIKNMERINAMNRTMTSKTSGSDIVESSLDMLKRQANPDIILELDYTINQQGPKKSVSYNIRGLDSYSNKQVAASSNTGAPSFSADAPTLLQEAVLSNIDNFNSQLQMHFDDLFANGREVTIGIQVFSNSAVDLETEFDGHELNEIISEWLYQNTVQHRFNEMNSSENFMFFEQVRIPLFNEKGRPEDTKSFVQGLQKFLKAAPYNITSKVDQRGLGQAFLIIGDK